MRDIARDVGPLLTLAKVVTAFATCLLEAFARVAKRQYGGDVIIPAVTIELDWKVSQEDAQPPEEQAPPSFPEPPQKRRRPRRRWLVLLGAVLLAAALAVYSARTYRARLEQVSVQVRLVARLEAQAVSAGDRPTFLALQDLDDDSWRALQDKRFARLERVGLPELGWVATGSPPQPGGVSLEPGGARLDVTYRLSVTQPMSGGLETVTLRVPQFYKPTPSGWVRAMPSADYWGHWRVKTGKRFAMAYVQRDASLLEPLIPRMDAALEDICGPFPCPSQPVFITFDITADTLARLTDLSLGFDDGAFALRLPSPHLFGVPADARSRDELYRAIGTRVVQALVYEASQRRLNMSYLASQEILRWELVQAGLSGPFVTPSVITALDRAMQSGAWQPLDAISLRSSPNGMENAPGEAMVPLAFDFLEHNLGTGTVARLVPTIGSGRVRTLGDVISTTLRVSPATLRPAWATYLRNRAGLPTVGLFPPEGELALLCAVTLNRSTIWRVGTDGTGLERLTPSNQNVVQPSWSPDGKMLAYLQGNVGVVMDPDAMQSKTLQAAYAVTEIAWLPDGRVRVNLRGDPTSHLVNLDTQQVVEITRTSPVWSPDGTRMAYQDLASFGVWIARANDGDAQTAGRGALPAWSLDGRRLAFLSGSTLGSSSQGVELESATQISIVDAAGRLVTTLPLGESLQALLDDSSLASRASSLTWSPDGSMLVVQISRPEGPMLLVLDTDTGAVRVHWRKLNVRLSLLAWSSSNRHIALRVTPGGLSRESDTVGILDVRTGGYLALPGRGFDWSPDGKWLAVSQDPTGILLVTPDLVSMRWLDTASCPNVAWRPVGR
jgi:WD40 repeat protein